MADGPRAVFGRLAGRILATRPDAARATEAAVNLGQDDDITVLTLNRLGTGKQSSSHLSTPHFAQV